jgi:hypothetical protein
MQTQFQYPRGVKMSWKYCFVFLIMIIGSCGFAQTELPRAPAGKPAVGRQLPYFRLTDVQHFELADVSPDDFRGKWLFMEFWFSGCTVCIKNFPKMNSIQKRFKEQIQFLLIGSNGRKLSGRNIAFIYENLRKKLNLDLAIAYDSVLDERWDIWQMPHIIIVNPEGTVVAITDGRDMTEEKVGIIIEGGEVSFYPAGGFDVNFDAANISDTSKLLYRSVLSYWTNENQEVPGIDAYISYSKRPGFRVTGATLFWLYNLAYFGRDSWSNLDDSLYATTYPYPMLELQDPGLFKFDFLDKKGIYNYEVVIPASRNDPKVVRRILQNDLQNVFGYKVSVESRIVPVWKLVANKDAAGRLRNRGHATEWKGYGDGIGGFKFWNYPVSFLLTKVIRYISDGEIPYFDETGITQNIDIEIKALLTDRDEVVGALRKNGLDLVYGKKLMTVLVISDP